MSVDLTASIVRILKPDGTTAGTGFVVSDEGLIATCSHVVQSEESQERGDPRPEYADLVFHATGDHRRARVVPDWWRPANAEDVAILRLEGPLPEGVTRLPLGSSVSVEGRTFSTFGFPEVKPVEGMAGRCEVIGRTTEGGFPVLQLRSSEVTPGFSGAPVWDDALHVVVGMVVSIAPMDRYGRQAETAFIIPVETLRAVCPTLCLPEGEPYRGLQAFEAKHADLYFGREAATRELLEALSRHDVVLLVGVSGSGKSSLVRAGLEKGLRECAIPGLVERLRCLVVPGGTPMLSSLLALADLPERTLEGIARAFDLPLDALGKDTSARREANSALNAHSPQILAEALRSVSGPVGLLLIVDQAEQLYTDCPDEAVRCLFIDTLLAAAGDALKVLWVLRADFYERVLKHPGLEQVIKQGGQMTLGRMSEANLRQAIQEPAWALGRSFQPGLAGRLAADVQGQAGDLPLLEFALAELWKQDSQKGVLTLATYEALGYTAPDGQRFPGVQGALARRAEEVWQSLGEAGQKAGRRIFLGLVTPGAVDERGERVAEDASRRVWQAEWDETTRQMAQPWVNARLLTPGRDPLSGQPTVEVAHEALIRAWPRLQRWLADYRPFVRWFEGELMPFLRRWLDQKQHPDLLLPAAMLVQAQQWLERYPGELFGPPAEYIRASVERQEQERAARERRQRRLTLAAVGVAVVFSILAVVVGILWWRSEEQRRIAVARQLAAQSQMALDNTGTGLVRSVLLAVESLRHYPTLEGDQALRHGLDLLPDQVVRMEHGGTVSAVVFSPDGYWMVTAGGNTVHVWEAITGQKVAQMEHEDDVEDKPFSKGGIKPPISCVSAVRTAAFSPDGRRVALGSGDSVCGFGEVRVWETITGREVVRMEHEEAVNAIAFSPNGRWVASAERCPGLKPCSATVRVWEAATGEEIVRMEHDLSVNAVAFSPDGQWVASGEGCLPPEPCSATARVWEVTTGREVASMVHGGSVDAVTFSPDGRWVVSGSTDGTARVWEATTGREVARMVHEGGVMAVALSPDGRWVVSGGWDDTARVWEAATGEKVAQMEHEGGVNAVAFSPDGRWVASADECLGLEPCSATARVWEAATGKEVGRHEGLVSAMAFSPDGQWVVSGNSGELLLWKIVTGPKIIQMDHKKDVEVVAFSPNGQWVASSSRDGTVRIWEVATGREAAQVVHEGGAAVVAFSPDGQWMASGGGEPFGLGEVRVWETATGQEIARRTHEGLVWAVTFSPDGRWVASGSGKPLGPGRVQVWEAATGKEVGRHEGSVWAVTFSPDGRWVAWGGWSDIVHVWEVATGREVASMVHGGSVNAVTFSPDGRWVASGSTDGTVCVGEATTGREVARMPHEEAVSVVTFSPDGRWVASGSTDGTACVWEATTGREVASMVHGGSVNAVTFSPDGRWVASGSTDGTVCVWEATTGREVARMLHEEAVSVVTFSPDGLQVASGSRNGTVRVSFWRPENLIAEACARLLRNLTREEWRQYLGDEPYRPTCLNLPGPEE